MSKNFKNEAVLTLREWAPLKPWAASAAKRLRKVSRDKGISEYSRKALGEAVKALETSARDAPRKVWVTVSGKRSTGWSEGGEVLWDRLATKEELAAAKQLRLS